MRLIVILMAIAASVSAGPRDWAGIRGRVTDPSGALVPGAAVHAHHASDGAARSALTDSQGRYAFERLNPGVYELSVEAAGFAAVRQRVEAQAAVSTSLDIRLEIGSLAELVTVTAKTPALESGLETRTRNHQEVLEIRQVRESSARDVGEALSDLAGMQKVRRAAIANDIALRAFQQGNLNVLVDGARIFGACPNRMDPPAFHVDFAEIQHVEVTKGAFDMRHEGSLGGMVNVVNKTPLSGLRITPTISAGSFGHVNPSVTGSLGGERSWASAGYSFRRSDPYTDGAGRRFTEYANYRAGLDSDAYRVGTAWFKAGLSLADGRRLNLGYTRQRGGETLYPYLMMDAMYDNADRLNASYDMYAVGPLHRVRLESYFTRVKHWMTDERRISSAMSPRPYSMATFASTKAAGGRAEAEAAGLIFGLEAYRRNWDGVNAMGHMGMYMDQHSIPNVNTTVAGLYTQYQKTYLGRLHVTAGARLDRARSEARSSTVNTDLYWAYKNTRSLSRSDMHPSASAAASYVLTRGLELFAGLGRTVRLPDAGERYMALKRMGGSDWVGDPELDPVKNTEADAGISFRAGRVMLRPTLFYSVLDDFIAVHSQARQNIVASLPNAAARSFANVGARMYGGELGYSVGVTRSLLFSGGLSHVRGAKDLRPGSSITDRDMAEVPPLRVRNTLRYGTRLFFAEAEAVATGAQERVDSALLEKRTPGYAVFGLRGGFHGEKLNFTAGVGNLLNRFYYEHFSYQRDAFRTGTRVPEPGRSFYINLSYGF